MLSSLEYAPSAAVVVEENTLCGLFDSRNEAISAAFALQAMGIPNDCFDLISWEDEEDGSVSMTRVIGVGAASGVAIALLLSLGSTAIPFIPFSSISQWFTIPMVGTSVGICCGLIRYLLSYGDEAQGPRITLVLARVGDEHREAVSAILERRNGFGDASQFGPHIKLTRSGLPRIREQTAVEAREVNKRACLE